MNYLKNDYYFVTCFQDEENTPSENWNLVLLLDTDGHKYKNIPGERLRPTGALDDVGFLLNLHYDTVKPRVRYSSEP